MDLSIDNRVAMIVGGPETLSTPATNKLVVDTAHGDAWLNRTPRHVSQTVRDGSTPGDTGMDVRSKPAPSPVIIGSTNIYPAFGLSGSLKVRKK